MASGWKWVNDPIQVMREAQKSIQSNSTYTEKENRLPFWIQLVDGFGWDTMKSVLIGYEADRMLDDSTLLPSDEQEKKDQWLVRYSKMAKHNLSKFMKDIWGLEISDSAKKEVEAFGLPSWMPAMVSADEAIYGISLFLDHDQKTNHICCFSGWNDLN